MELYTGDRAEYANQENTDSVLYYDHTCQDGIQAEVTVTEANFYAEDVKVFVNDSEYAIEDWSSEGDEWTGHIRLSEEGTYTIRITYTDRSGNVMKTYESEPVSYTHLDVYKRQDRDKPENWLYVECQKNDEPAGYYKYILWFFGNSNSSFNRWNHLF